MTKEYLKKKFEVGAESKVYCTVMLCMHNVESCCNFKNIFIGEGGKCDAITILKPAKVKKNVD